MADITSLKKAQEKESYFTNLWSRMDTSKDRVYQTEYALKDSKGKTIPGVISVTMNDAAVFANAITSALMAAKWQTLVEGNISSKQSHVVETFIEDAFAAGDERLNRRGEPGLFPWLCNHVCIRSYLGSRFLIYKDKTTGELVVDSLPVDMRYVTYEIGMNGLDWVAPKFTRNKDQIMAEYGIEVKDKTAEVVDYWDGKVNEIWVAGQLAASKPNPLGYPPFVITCPATGFMLRDSNYLEHEAEDLFFLNSKLYDEWNRSVSIEQTIAMKQIMPPYQKPSKLPPQGEPVPYPDKIGAVNEVAEGEEYHLLQVGDVNNAHRMSVSNIGGALQRGGVNNIDLGNVSQEVSAVWITEQSEIRSKILEPRLQALATFKAMAGRMLIDQFIKGGYSASLGRAGLQKEYSAGQLGDPKNYSVSYRLMSRSKKQEIANLAMAQGARGIVSQETILTDILQVDDPAGELAKLDAEKAEQADPVLFYLRKACSLADEAETLEGDEADQKKMESMLMTERGVALLKQRQNPQPQAEPKIEQPKGNSNALIPLLGQGGMKGTVAKEGEG